MKPKIERQLEKLNALSILLARDMHNMAGDQAYCLTCDDPSDEEVKQAKDFLQNYEEED